MSEPLIEEAAIAESQHSHESQLIKERLQFKTERDNAGFERRVYSINGVTFSFKGREELPTYQTLTSSRTIFLGEAPNWVETEDYQRYLEQLRATQAQENAPQHFIVNKTLLGVVELAIQLGSKDTSLPQLREDLPKGIYSQRALALLDDLVASNFNGSFGVDDGSETQAEALVLLSLLGDDQAQTVVAENVKLLEKYDSDKRTSEVAIIKAELMSHQTKGTDSLDWEEEEKAGPEALKVEDLCAVHATNFKPEATSEGGLVIPTSFDATKGRIVRNSIHVCLNGKVQPAGYYGSWEDAGYAIVSPFEEMVKDSANGPPAVLNTVDTCWARNPGEPLIFPNAFLVEPGGSEIQGLFQEEGKVVRFKSAGLDVQDLINLQEYSRIENFYDDFSRSIEGVPTRIESAVDLPIDLFKQWDLRAAGEAIDQYLYHGDKSMGRQPKLLAFLTEKVEGQTLETRIRSLFETSKATSGLHPDVIDKDIAVDRLVKVFAYRIRATMFSELNELSVRYVIKKMGLIVQQGGNRGWGGMIDVTDPTAALAGKLEIGKIKMETYNDDNLPVMARQAVDWAKEGGHEEGKFVWKNYNFDLGDMVKDFDPKTRRVLYASGVLTARN